MVALSDAIAEVSFPVRRMPRRPGTANAAMMLMIATTISSSMRVKPYSDFRIMMTLLRNAIYDARATCSAGAQALSPAVPHHLNVPEYRAEERVRKARGSHARTTISY